MSIKRIIFLSTVCFSLLITSAVHSKTILVYGDSLSAAYNLDLDQGWASLLANRLIDDHRVVNASISGESSSGGLARLPATLEEFSPDLVLLELGANDGLRGYSIDKMEANLIAMIELIKNSGAQVVVFGITLPPSYGPRYIDSFEAAFASVAEETEQHYFDFVVEKFIGDSTYIQNDGLHPTAAAQPKIEGFVFDYLKSKNLLD